MEKKKITLKTKGENRVEKKEITANDVLSVAVIVIMAIALVLLIAYAVQTMYEVTDEVHGMTVDKASREEGSITCTITELSTMVQSGLIQITHYYMTVTDADGETRKFRIGFNLYEKFSENDTVEITYINQRRNDGTPCGTQFYCNNKEIVLL